MARRLARFTAVKGHCKDEFYPLPKPLRLINAREDFSKGFLGPSFATIEHVVCKLPWFIKYVPVKDRPRAITDKLIREGANYVCTDYTSFEAHFEPHIMWAIEEPLYRFMCGNLPHEERDSFLKFWKEFVAGTNRMNIAGNLDCTLPGVRMSGEMNTSLGNGWCNLVLFLFAVYQRGASWDDIFGDTVSGFVEGDDGLFRVPPHLSPTTEQMASYGFCLKIESTPDITEASFCGQVFDPENNVVMTDPGHVLMKLGWAGRKYLLTKQQTLDEILLAKAMSTLYQYNGCPIIAVACLRIIQVLKSRGVLLSERAKASMGWYKRPLLEEADLLSWDVLPIAESTRLIVARLYGFEVDEQLALEAALRNWQYGQPIEFQLPPSYDMYARAYDDYVLYPTQVDNCARKRHYEALADWYVVCGNKLPAYKTI